GLLIGYYKSMVVIPYIIASLIPLIVLYVIYSLDLYQMGAFKNVLAAFIWGVAAFFLARYLNRYLFEYNWLTRSEIVRYFAPFAEEILKALVLVYLVRRPNFTYFVDGAIYGFAAGMGFAIFENFEYINTSDAGLGTAIGRVLSANLIHASASALVGVAFGLTRFQRGLRRALTVLGGLLAAMLVHGVFNNIVDREIPGPVLVYSVVLGLAAVGLIAFFILRGLAEQKVWIEQSLGLTDRVSGQEARIAQRLEDAHELLKPLRAMDQFSDEQVDKIENFVVIQAQLGIKRKTLEKLPDEKMRQAVEKDMAELRTKMDQARQALGPYLMFYVRNIFPPEESPLFDLIGERLEEKVAAQKSSGGPSWGAAFGDKLSASISAAKDEEQGATQPGNKDGAAGEKSPPGSSWMTKDIGSGKEDS
ncbi:PrsW family glutamic-type intramembrane protease, partial [Chloroflexota bacterium]